MMKRTWVWALPFALALPGTALLTALAAGCGSASEDCDLLLCDPKYADAGAGGGAGDAGNDAVSPNCGLPPSEWIGEAPDGCGIYADPNASPTDADGSRAHPFPTLGAAIAAAKATNQPVLACGKTFPENVVLPAGTTLYGALACDAGWAYAPSSRTLIAPPPKALGAGTSEIALTLSPGSGETLLQDVDVIAPSGVDPGASSIAALVLAVKATFTRCDLTAGDGVKGENGNDGDAADIDGLPGNDGVSVCAAGAVNPGPAGPAKACWDGASSNGGKGGDGGALMANMLLSGGAGEDGTPADPASPMSGKGGAGEGAMVCTGGQNGAPGGPGADAKGSSAMGAFSAMGYSAPPADAGISGKPGQGGGGGGGAKGGLAVACMSVTLPRVGSSGGSGGSGGCGGKGGLGGGAGGGSFALVSAGAEVTLQLVTLASGNGGDGGDGGSGQLGGNPGQGHNGGVGAGAAKNACRGGDGGNGGNGGAGGGGRGGHSIPLAFTGQIPSGTPMMTKGAAGKGGAAGLTSQDPVMGQGQGGIAADNQVF